MGGKEVEGEPRGWLGKPLSSWSQGWRSQVSLRLANAVGAYKHSCHACPRVNSVARMHPQVGRPPCFGKCRGKPWTQLEPEIAGCDPSLLPSPLGNLISPAHLDWDMLLDPPYLFSPSPATERGECEGSAWPPLRCQVVIHALSGGQPISWEVTASLDSLMLAKDSQTKEEPPQQQSRAWDKLLHHLTAGSVIRDNENMAQREAELEHGEPLFPFLGYPAQQLVSRQGQEEGEWPHLPPPQKGTRS